MKSDRAGDSWGITMEDRQLLLRLARMSLTARAEGRKFDPDTLEGSDELRQHRGCFVTLFKNGELRGCIGHVLPQMPLYRSVSHNACAAGFHDTRFEPVSLSEIEHIQIEISVLSELQLLNAVRPEEILAALRPGEDGVLLRFGSQMSTFLPQVWETLRDKEEFLSRLCAKAGWNLDFWKSGQVSVSVYQAISFSDQDFK